MTVTMNKKLFWLLSLTWGLPMTLVGGVVYVTLRIVGYKTKKVGYATCFEVGDNWGGFSAGPVIVTCKNPGMSLLSHEHGHSINNCQLGPFMIVGSIASMVRYWYRELRYNRRGLTPPTDYDDFWFEALATRTGNEFFKTYKEN